MLNRITYKNNKYYRPWETRNYIEIDGVNCSLSCRMHKTSTVLIKNVSYKITKRNMQRATNPFYHIGTKLIPPTRPVLIQKRYLPDSGYTIVKPKNKIIGKDPQTGNNIYSGNVVTSTGKELPLHEQSHAIVRDNETDKDVGVLTSAKDPKKGNINIAPENYKGDQLPDGKSKPQQFRAFDSPRYSKLTKNMKEDVEATAFAKKYEKELNDAVKKSNNHTKPALARFDKDSSHLYHENGQPIYDKNGKEIDYD